MNVSSWIHPDEVLVEIAPRRLGVAHAGVVHAWPLARSANGSLTEECVARIRSELPGALGRRTWVRPWAAPCAVPAAGVTLRRWQIPEAAGAELHRVLALRIESELPLAPEALAWGWRVLARGGGVLEVLVAAMKRGVIDEYTGLLTSCGLAPWFTPGALARLALAEPGAASVSSLDIGREQSEWVECDGIGPRRLRVLPWGMVTVETALERQAGTGLDAAGTRVGETDLGAPEARRVVEGAVGALVALLPGVGTGSGLRVTGLGTVAPALREALERALGSATGGRCVFPEAEGAGGWSATLEGLRREAAANGGEGAVVLRSAPGESGGRVARSGVALRRYAVLAAVLLGGLLGMPYAEALLLRPRLAARVAAVKARQADLSLIDREYGFLRHLKANQAPYLDALVVLGQCAPPGCRVEAFSLNRKGELSLRFTLRQPQEVTAFRSKLTESGFFASVVVEEQTPTPDRQKIVVRLSAQVKPPEARQGLSLLAVDGASGPGRPGPGSSSRAGPTPKP